VCARVYVWMYVRNMCDTGERWLNYEEEWNHSRIHESTPTMRELNILRRTGALYTVPWKQ
jgi:hypothetical protein